MIASPIGPPLAPPIAAPIAFPWLAVVGRGHGWPVATLTAPNGAIIRHQP